MRRDPALEAASAADRLPPLLLAADRVASAVVGGVHGRRRAGQGDSFWEYRPIRHGEPASGIDWRRSARDGKLFVRETEWEAAQTACLWRDGSARMAWRSDAAHPTKSERAGLLLLALASLLLKAGERPRLAGAAGLGAALSGPGALGSLAASLARQAPAGPPAAAAMPAYSNAVLFGDFLLPVADTASLLAALAARPVRGVLVQVLDPAEIALPFRGRVRFRGLSGEGDMLAPKAETLAASYAARLAAHQDELRRVSRAAGFDVVVHCTADPPERALLALHERLGGRHA